MSEIFPEPIRNLPQAYIPLDGVKAYISQAENQQIIFMETAKDIEVPEHSHEAWWSVVLAGKAELTVDDIRQTYSKGDSVFVPKGVKHSAKIYAGYAGVSLFDEKDYYGTK